MDENIKNRLVGIVVIFALAVIFLPMILDGSGVRKDSFDVVIPPEPVVTADPDFETRVIELNDRVDAIPQLEQRFVDEVSSEARAPASPASEAAGQVARVDPKPEPVAQAADTQAAPTGGASWVLQVGSFQDRQKALAQRDKLRSSNIAAVFVEQFSANNKTSYRVRLGPFLKSEQARVAQNKIKAKHNIDGIIMKYER